MNLDATTALLVVILAGFVRDGLLAWRLLGLLGERGGPFPPTPPVEPPITPPVPPVVVPPVVEPPVVKPPVTPPVVVTPPIVTPPVPPAVPATGPRFTVTATDFAGPNDSASSSESAYDGHIIRGATELAAALPYHFPGTPPAIRVFANSRTADVVPIKDVGPWNTHDPYWDGSGHPLAESQYATQTKAQNGRVPSNPSGIDLTPAVYKALGFSGDLNNITTHLSWDFVSVLDKGTVAPSVPVSPIGPTQPAPVVVDGLIRQTWPTQAECPAFYGSPSTVAASLVKVHCPWVLTVEGTHTQNITIHSKCAASLTRVLNYIWNHPSIGQSQDKINEFGYSTFDGSYNPRNIAGTNTPSVHSYAAAMDFNAAQNGQGTTEAQAKFKPDSLIVYAFEAEGAIWGGRWSGSTRDPMHFQYARVR